MAWNIRNTKPRSVTHSRGYLLNLGTQRTQEGLEGLIRESPSVQWVFMSFMHSCQPGLTPPSLWRDGKIDEPLSSHFHPTSPPGGCAWRGGAGGGEGPLHVHCGSRHSPLRLLHGAPGQDRPQVGPAADQPPPQVSRDPSSSSASSSSSSSSSSSPLLSPFISPGALQCLKIDSYSLLVHSLPISFNISLPTCPSPTSLPVSKPVTLHPFSISLSQYLLVFISLFQPPLSFCLSASVFVCMCDSLCLSLSQHYFTAIDLVTSAFESASSQNTTSS